MFEAVGLVADGVVDSSSQSSSSSSSGVADEEPPLAAAAAAVAAAVVDALAAELTAAVAVLPVIPFIISSKSLSFVDVLLPHWQKPSKPNKLKLTLTLSFFNLSNS